MFFYSFGLNTINRSSNIIFSKTVKTLRRNQEIFQVLILLCQVFWFLTNFLNSQSLRMFGNMNEWFEFTISQPPFQFIIFRTLRKQWVSDVNNPLDDRLFAPGFFPHHFSFCSIFDIAVFFISNWVQKKIALVLIWWNPVFSIVDFFQELIRRKKYLNIDFGLLI